MTMQTDSKSPEFLLLVRGTDWKGKLSADEIQVMMARFADWMEDLTKRGVLKGAQPLKDEGVYVTGRHENSVVDGPFAESKEAVGGYFLLQLDTFEQAVEIARNCPMVEYGGTLEVRPIAVICPMLAEHYAREKQKQEAAAV